MKQDGFRSKLKDLRSLGIRVAASTLYHSGVVNLFRNMPQRTRAKLSQDKVHPFAVLLYHRVNPDEDRFFPAISVKVFEEQMRYLARNFQVLSLADIIRRIQHGDGVEPLTIAITFDDGYRDNYTFAHPILKKYRLPAMLFVATGFVGSHLLMWNDRLAWAVKNTEQKNIVWQVGSRKLTLSLENQEDKVGSLNILLEELKACPEAKKTEILTNVVAALGNKKQEPSQLMLNWRELRTMAEEGWDVGSHTVNHLILTKVELSQAAKELKVSKDTIEQKLQRSVRLCAFPNGKETDFNTNIKGIVKELGYQGAATTLGGINGRNLDFFELRRWSVWEKHLPALACKLSYLYWRAKDHGKDY
jgi:peptidoglycan/xylan/chitin deacetylase (PgdA/CDA1 family)